MTFGEKRVRVEFNPSNNDTVSQIKQKSAELINLLESLKTVGEDGYIFTNSGEQLRLISLAQTSIEEGAMWGVKAATI